MSGEGDLRAEVIALVGEHIFDVQEWDTGVRKCRHPEHVGGYSAVCHRAWLREQLPSVFPPRELAQSRVPGEGS